MQLDNYLTKSASGIQFTREQASRFAKEIAGDFNPLHNTDGKLFCVPGDLLFAVALNQYGLSQHMRFNFSGMVADGIDLIFPVTDEHKVEILDSEGKEYLTIERNGEVTQEANLIRDLTYSYVTFSGTAFPHILVPLMRENNTMVNPGRPMVIYESMEIDLNHLDFSDPELELSEAKLQVNGKKGDIRLAFNVKSAGEIVGCGTKFMLLRGLRPFDEAQMNTLVEDYTKRKNAYLS